MEGRPCGEEVHRNMLLELGFLVVGNRRKCELLDRGLRTRAANTLVRSLLCLAIRVFVLVVPVWEIGVLDGVHLLPKVNAIVEISFELLTLPVVVDHRLAMLESIRLVLLGLAGIGKVVPHVSLRAVTFTFLHLEARVLIAVQNGNISTVGYRQYGVIIASFGDRHNGVVLVSVRHRHNGVVYDEA